MCGIAGIIYKRPPDERHPQDSADMFLREALRERLPHTILSRPKKEFSVPVPEILRLLREQTAALLEYLPGFALSEILYAGKVRALFSGEDARKNAVFRQWTVLVLLAWFRAVKL